MGIHTLLLFLAGLFLLIAGAEALVRGASRLAAAVGISPLVIGLTVVAFGTGSPEFAVSVGASWNGSPNLALGNVVGSNICNILLILGVVAVITPLTVAQQLVRWEVPLMVGVSGLLLIFGWDGAIDFSDGLVLLVGLTTFIGIGIWTGRREPPEVYEEYNRAHPRPKHTRMWLQLVLIVVGLAMLVLGSRWLVLSAVEIAVAAGLSELVIGLTIVAVGTSLPEIVTSVMASIRGECDIAVGNAIGSNLFNMLAVLGFSAVISPDGIPVPTAALHFDLIVMTAAAVACFPIFVTGYRIDRWEGGLFLCYFIAYNAYLILASQQHDLLPLFSQTMLWFVIPLTVVTLVVITLRSFTLLRK